MECLEKLKHNEADFVAVDPEDMYVAYQIDNDDFSVFSEIRTVEEPDGKFNDEIENDENIKKNQENLIKFQLFLS